VTVFSCHISQNEKKYFRPVPTYKLNSVKERDADVLPLLVDRSAELNSTGLPVSVIFGNGRMRRKDEDLITW